MADIRISALPNEPAPSGSDFVPIDLASTRKTTATLLVQAGRPTATQAEAEAGTDPTKAMTPLTTKQAITFQGAAAFVPLARTLTAGSGLTGGGDLSANRSFAVNFSQVQPFSTKLTNIDGLTYSGGDLIYATGVNTFANLPIGTNNQVLRVTGGVLGWASLAGTGDVVGPASSVDLTLATYSGTTGKILLAGNPAILDVQTALADAMPTMQNNVTDAVNDIDFLAGACVSSDATRWPMRSTSTITKQLDAAWAVGNNAGGRMSAAAIANVPYHCYQIRRPDTGVVDFGFDVSATAPNLPTNYTQYRRIGAILRESGTIVPFRQYGDHFNRVTKKVDRSSTASAASALLTLSVPTGIKLQPIIYSSLILPVSSSTANQINDGDGTVADINYQSVATGAGSNGATQSDIILSQFFTNTSAQVYFSVNIGSGTITSNILYNIGWIDTRGRT